MLTEIMKAIKQSNGTIDMAELSRQFRVDKETLKGMLETLERQGKLITVSSCSGGYPGCGSSHGRCGSCSIKCGK